MKDNREKILILKSDKIGDFINFSPCLKILKDNIKDCHISMVCSKYNFPIVKNYTYIDNLIVFKSKYFIINLIRNFKTLFKIKYNYLFQCDGKNSSYWIALFIAAKIKSTICFIKHKNILKFEYDIYRPSKIFLGFFSNHEFCYENYSQHSHYQSIYIKLLENLHFKIFSKKNLFFLVVFFEPIFNDFYNKTITKSYILFHFDEKWDKYDKVDRDNILKIINKTSSKKNVVITLGIKKFFFADELNKIFSNYNFITNKFLLVKKKSNNNVFLLNNVPLNLLAYFVKNSVKNVSSHAGTIVHMSPAFDKGFVDIIKKSKNEEYNRWIPLISNYKRINFEEINEKYLENFEI